MSRLDEILDTEDWDTMPNGDEFAVYRKVDKEEVKLLILDLIGKDEQYDKTAYMNGNTQAVALSRSNQTKEEIRRKVRQL